MLPRALSCHLKNLLLIGAVLSGRDMVSIFSFFFNAAVQWFQSYKRYFRADSALFMRIARVRVNTLIGNLALNSFRWRKQLRSLLMTIFHNSFIVHGKYVKYIYDMDLLWTGISFEYSELLVLMLNRIRNMWITIKCFPFTDGYSLIYLSGIVFRPTNQFLIVTFLGYK